ncbi:MAG: DUF58 domain-containing protein [Treponema sp.]
MMHIRISGAGAVYTVFSLLLLSTGLYRGELLSAACGGILSAYLLFAAAALLPTAWFWRREEPEIAVHGTRFTINPDSGVFPVCAPGVVVSYICELSLEPPPAAPAAKIVIPLQGRDACLTVEYLPRGRYFYRRQYLCLHDFAGFFSIIFIMQCSTDGYRNNRLLRQLRTYTVAPAPEPVAGLELPVLRSQHICEAPAAERTAELYESRPYIPGDDPRKIHWKLYAHTGSLSIKLGAYQPPPVKHVSIYIEEPSVPDKKDRKLLAPFFDAFIGRVSTLILHLLEAGIRCTIIVYDYPQGHAAGWQQNTADSSRRENRTASSRASVPAAQKLLHTYTVSNENPDAFQTVLQLLARPTVLSAPAADSTEVFQTVSKEGSLLYCYMPLPSATAKTFGMRTHEGTAAGIFRQEEHSSGADGRMNASGQSDVQTLFYLAASPAIPVAKKNTIPYRMRQLLYPPAVSARQKTLMRRLAAAAEYDLHLFTERNHHAKLL